MLLSSLGPILSPSVSAHNTPNTTIWPKEGSEDTGWVLLNSTGADGTNGAPAMTDWTMEFAPGATLQNLSFEVRVDGGAGITIQEPLIISPDSGQTLFDWRNSGWLGQSFGFDGSNPHQGRLASNADVGATFTIPSGTEITDLILEVLAPADPFTSLQPVNLYVTDYAIHPVDGRLYLAIGDYIVILDAMNTPHIIDLFQIKNSDGENYVNDLELDIQGDRIIMTTQDGDLLSVNLTDTSWNADLPAEPSGSSFNQIHLASNGKLFAFSEAGIFTLNSAGTGWTLELASGTTNWPVGTPFKTIEHNGIIYSAILGGGVALWDLSTMSALSPWSTANNLHSDYVSGFLISGNQLLISSFDAGVARRDLSGNFWLATWNNGNWLTSNNVKGMTLVNNKIQILTDSNVHIYNTNSGTFTSTVSLSSLGQSGEGQNIIYWPSGGSRAPANDQVLISSEATAIFAILEPGNSPLYSGDLVIGSGPQSTDMKDAMQFNGIVYAGSDSFLDRYSLNQARWLAPIPMGNTISQIVNDGTNVIVGTYGSGIHIVDPNGNILDTWDTSDGLASDDVSNLDVEGDWIVASHLQDGVSVFNQSSTGVTTLNEQNSDLDSNAPTGIAIHAGIAYIGTSEDGLNRYIIENDTFLGSWVSTGINDVDYAPIAILGTGSNSVLHLGLPGFGIARKDLTTGEILIPLTEEPDRGNPGPEEILPSNQIYALEENNGNLYIGTGQGGLIWNGQTASDFTQGTSWDKRPTQFFDFVIDGTTLYAGTNIGVCKYTASSGSIDDCQNAQDGLPNWGVSAVGVNSTTIFAGTNDGVGLIDKSSFSVTGTWEAGEETENAVVEVIGNVAYVGLNGIGVARYDVVANSWLTTWTEDNILDDGNGDVTGLVADIRPDHLWVGGSDGFQLINVSSGTEVYDIEKSNSLYSGDGDPYDMNVYGDTLYYHQQYSSDNVYRIDIANFSSKSSLDAGQQVSENGGDVYGLEIIGDVLHISVASGQWWNTEGSGGIALYNVTSDSWVSELLPGGSVDRVTSFISSTDHTWVSWGESKLQVFAPNGSLAGEWDGLDFPIREIVEFDNEILFATTDGVSRFDETSFQWLTTWTPGSGLPNNADDTVYELWTNGTDLVVGTARTQGWQGTTGEISHLDSNGNWNSWGTGSNGIPNGYPIGMTMCAGLLHVAITANNGGVARFNLANSTVESSFNVQRLDDGSASAVACDDNSNILYIGYYDDEQPISRYNYNTNQWLSSITTSSNNIPTDPVWWGAMEFAGGKLVIGYEIGDQGNNIIGGGLVIMAANGATVGQASILSTGSPVSSVDWLGTQWLIGQAGGTSGYSHVDTINQLGVNTIHSLPNLVSGQITSMAGNETHLWVASASWQNTGSGVLQGIRLTNGSVEWQRGWTIPANAAVTDIELVGTDLYLSSNNRGLRLLDTTTGNLQSLPPGLHNYQDGIKKVGNDLYIGLQGTGTSSAGIQVFNTTLGNYTAGRLLAGLPSNNINGFLTVTGSSGIEMVYIATNNGIGRWNATGNNWETAWTALDGLPTSYVEDIIEFDSDIWMATPNGLSQYDTTTMSFTTYAPANGLMGTSTWGLVGKTTTSTTTGGTTITQNSLFMSHDGKGTDRPGVTQFNTMTQNVIAQHQFDQLPSNSVTAVTSDIWGVHIATNIGPLVHWVSSSGQFNTGVNVFTMQDWPVNSMRSDGTHLIAVGSDGVTVLGANPTSNSIVARFVVPGATGGSVVTNSYVWVSTNDGLRGWELNSGTEVPGGYLRRADPLSIGLQLAFTDVTNYTHPGMNFALVDVSNSVTLTEDGTPGPHNVAMQTVPLTLSSPVAGAATWMKLVDMKWNSTLNISDDPNLITSMQYAIDNGKLINGTRYVDLRLQSPTNGSMWVKIAYDWIRTETPIQGIALWDRPDDGGSALLANWTLVHDDDFSRYVIYLNEGPWPSQPTVADLQPTTPDASVSIHSRLQTEITSIGGQPLQDGVAYWAVVVVEYNDGRYGTPSAPFGPAIPTDEVPMPPEWATGSSGDQFVALDGDVFIEWARCTALDLASTRIYASTSEISDALGLEIHTEFAPEIGNVSTISLEAGRPHWLAFTCVDQSGQEDIMNATIIGPIVPTGGVDDGIPPPKLTGVWAEDVPQDDGGRVQIGWNDPLASDCAFITIYMRPVGDEDFGDFMPSSVDGFTEAKVVTDCETNMSIVDSIGEFPLIDGTPYFIGAVAFDKWLNGDTGDVTILEVTPFVNTIDGGGIPDRITALEAWDHPEDDGTAIDVAWTPSEADDFDYYVVWVAEYPVDDLTELWSEVGNDPGRCGCVVMNKQWIDEAKSPIQIEINTALYGGTDLLTGTPAQIQPNVKLYVTVTVHDIKGNVHLNDLLMDDVIPINNLEDSTPPPRLDSISLSDRPNDDGTAVLLEFDLSGESDIEFYEIYAASFSFTSVGSGGNGPSDPIMILERNPDLPITIKILAYDVLVIPNLAVTAAVVPVDSSGNALRDSLLVATTLAIDDGVTDPGEYLPNIEGVDIEWINDKLLVSWAHSNDPNVRSYVVFIANSEFTDTDDASMVGEVSASNSMIISPESYPSLSNKSTWWIGVSASDEDAYRKLIDSYSIEPDEGESGTDEKDDENPKPTDLGEFLTPDNLLLAGLILVALILLLAVVRNRGGKSGGRRSKDYELQEATWGIQARDGWDDVGSFGGFSQPSTPPPEPIKPQVQQDIYAAAQRIDSPAQSTQSQPQRWQQPTQQQNSGIDTSFLDDLL
jgi:hypothetical protein